MKYKDMTEVETLRQLEWSDHHEFSYDYAMWSFKKLKEYKKIIDKIKEIINHYAIENEDYSKIYNQEEQEILELLEEIE